MTPCQWLRMRWDSARSRVGSDRDLFTRNSKEYPIRAVHRKHPLPPPQLTPRPSGVSLKVMPVPIATYRISRHYLWAGIVALVFAVFSGIVALRWPYAWIAAGLLLGSAALVLYFALRIPIEIYETHLRLPRCNLAWGQIRRLDRSSSLPLIVHITLADKSRYLLVYPGDPDSSNSLLRHLRRFSREALIDGVPYRQFWGEAPSKAKDRKQSAPPRYPLLLPEDEADIERMFQRLKTVGHIDQKSCEDFRDDK